jgi:hypothetical protein
MLVLGLYQRICRRKALRRNPSGIREPIWEPDPILQNGYIFTK